jgi:phospholipid/cholesterol/gamma-HCH transport system substrate-binding protein
MADKTAAPSVVGTALKVSAFAVAMALVLAGVMQLLTRPVPGETDGFTAVFSDVSGLRVGDDIRVRGVQVGKVTTIDLNQDRTTSAAQRGPVATVQFTAVRNQAPTEASVASIRYQNLTGTRFVELAERAPKSVADATSTRSRRLPAGSVIGLDRTLGSFDITTVLHGLKPVLSTLAPEDINLLMESALTVVQGDGKGIGTLLQSVDRLATTANSKQRLITGLIQNLGTLAKTLGGNSPGLTSLISEFDQTATLLAGYAPDIRTWSDDSSRALVSINRLLTAVGLTPDQNPRLESLVDGGLTQAGRLLDLAGTVPVVASLLNSPPQPSADCSHGRAILPQSVMLMIAGHEVVVCNAR